MKAISLWEPWASAMALGLKHNETRSWPTSYLGDLAICSAKRKMEFEEWRISEVISAHHPEWQPVYGCVLCVVELFQCVQSQAFLSGMLPLSDLEQCLGNYTYGRWIWRTKNIRRLKTPMPIIGHQGLWNLPLEVVTQRNAMTP